MQLRFAALAAAFFLTTGCGYVGDPLPPLANVPSSVADLTAVQRGAHIIAQFTVPTRTTEGVAFKRPIRLDLRAGPSAAGFTPEQWTAVPEGPIHQGIARYEIPCTAWTGKDVTIAVRAIGANGKRADWSNHVELSVVEPPPKPVSVKAQATAQGVLLQWEGPPGSFRVFRRNADQKEFSRAGDSGELHWADHDTEYGTSYVYVVQRIVKLAENKEAESEPSEEAAITPVDTFPPAVPGGLRAVAAANSIELAWEGNTEADLAGYRIYRAPAGGEFQKLSDAGGTPTFSDHGVEHGKTYRYAVTAVDKSGNESARSAIAEATLP